MDPVLLRSFVAAAETGAFSRAADQVGVAQPSLTAQIQRLERHLGAVLFVRHGRGVSLTEAGEALHPRAVRLLEEVRAAEEAVRLEQRVGERTVRVGAIPTVAPYLLPAALQRLRQRDGAVRVTLHEDYSAALARLLQEGGLDVVIAALPYAFDAVECEVLGTDALVVAVPASHAAARAGRISLAQLHEAPAITLDPAHCLGEQVDGFCASRGVAPGVVCRSAQLSTVLELVGAGIGVSIVPAMAASRHNTPNCAYLPLAEQPLSREIVALWRRGTRLSPAARAFVERVREVMRR
jgi:LysR family hydrogen peroxide-inducible transcriptional activator